MCTYSTSITFYTDGCLPLTFDFAQDCLYECSNFTCTHTFNIPRGIAVYYPNLWSNNPFTCGLCEHSVCILYARQRGALHTLHSSQRSKLLVVRDFLSKALPTESWRSCCYLSCVCSIWCLTTELTIFLSRMDTKNLTLAMALRITHKLIIITVAFYLLWSSASKSERTLTNYLYTMWIKGNLGLGCIVEVV